MDVKILFFYLLTICTLLNSGAFGYTVISRKGTNTNRVVSNTPRIAALMFGKAFVIERYKKNRHRCGPLIINNPKWITFPEDKVAVVVSYSAGKGSYTQVVKPVKENESGSYRLSNSTLNSVKKRESAFECLIKIMFKEPVTQYMERRYFGRGRSKEEGCNQFQLKLQRIIEVYELLEHASSYQENNSDGVLFHLTDPGFVVDYCKQNGYM
jgi:hypothetical protein